MYVELRLKKDDLETKAWIKTELALSENDFVEIRSFDGAAIILSVFVALESLIKNPEIIDRFLKRDGCEVEFDKEGNLLRAKGYTASEIIKLKAAFEKNNSQN